MNNKCYSFKGFRFPLFQCMATTLNMFNKLVNIKS